MNEDWKDLEIGNIPSNFRENNNYEVLFKAIDGSWNEDTEDRICILHRLIDGSREYRYRLKPLESIRITRDIVNALGEHYNNHFGDDFNHRVLEERFNRKVEIID